MKKHDREFDRLVKHYKKKLFDLWERADNAKSLEEVKRTHDEFNQLCWEMDELDDPRIAKLTRKGSELIHRDYPKNFDEGAKLYDKAWNLRDKLREQGKKLLYDELELDRKAYIRVYEYGCAHFTGEPAPRV